MTADLDPASHPEALALAGYLDGALTGPDKARVEAHLAGCTDCRAEVAAVARLIRTAPLHRRLELPLRLAAAAVLVALLVPALDLPTRLGPGPLREPAVTTTAAPIAIAPVGAVDSVPALVWSAVPHATRYRATLHSGEGTAVWRTETTDTVAALPDTVRLRPGASYFWKVEAETGFDRWVTSDLVDFTMGRPR